MFETVLQRTAAVKGPRRTFEEDVGKQSVDLWAPETEEEPKGRWAHQEPEVKAWDSQAEEVTHLWAGATADEELEDPLLKATASDEVSTASSLDLLARDDVS